MHPRREHVLALASLLLLAAAGAAASPWSVGWCSQQVVYEEFGGDVTFDRGGPSFRYRLSPDWDLTLVVTIWHTRHQQWQLDTNQPLVGPVADIWQWRREVFTGESAGLWLGRRLLAGGGLELWAELGWNVVDRHYRQWWVESPGSGPVTNRRVRFHGHERDLAVGVRPAWTAGRWSVAVHLGWRYQNLHGTRTSWDNTSPLQLITTHDVEHAWYRYGWNGERSLAIRFRF